MSKMLKKVRFFSSKINLRSNFKAIPRRNLNFFHLKVPFRALFDVKYGQRSAIFFLRTSILGVIGSIQLEDIWYPPPAPPSSKVCKFFFSRLWIFSTIYDVVYKDFWFWPLKMHFYTPPLKKCAKWSCQKLNFFFRKWNLYDISRHKYEVQFFDLTPISVLKVQSKMKKVHFQWNMVNVKKLIFFQKWNL